MFSARLVECSEYELCGQRLNSRLLSGSVHLIVNNKCAMMAAEQSSICCFQGLVRCDLRRSRFSINSGLIPGFDSLNLQPLVRLHKIYLSGVDSPAPYQTIADPIVLVGRIKLLRNVWVVKLADNNNDNNNDICIRATRNLLHRYLIIYPLLLLDL